MVRLTAWTKEKKERALGVFHRHERLFTVGAFFFGFVFDNATLTRIDFWLDNLILISYLALSGMAILFVNAVEAGIVRRPFLASAAAWVPLIMQFAFGNLFSGYIVFYSRSAAFSVSWPFLLLLGFMFVGNEFFKQRYQRLGFQITVWYLVLFSFSVFYVPILVGSIGAGVFLLSGFASLGAIALFVYVLALLMPARFRASKRVIMGGIGSVFLLINLFYFGNIIPPLPLSLKDIGVYHSVERTERGGYRVVYEKKQWFEFFKRTETFHRSPGERVYIYSAVFAPTGLDTVVLHRWEYWDASTSRWVEANKFQFPVYGGSDRGYRGYSFKANVTPGLWRVDVITARGQVLGRSRFEIVADSIPEADVAVQIL